MRHRSQFLVFTVIVMLVAGVANHSGTAAVSSACALITQQEIATAVGAAVPSGKEMPMDFPVQGVVIKAQSCLYGSGAIVARYELGNRAQALFAQYRQEFASKPQATDYQNVDGVGDEAFSAKGQLMVRKGQTGLLIGISLGDRQNVRIAAKALQTEKALAAIALGRM